MDSKDLIAIYNAADKPLAQHIQDYYPTLSLESIDIFIQTLSELAQKYQALSIRGDYEYLPQRMDDVLSAILQLGIALKFDEQQKLNIENLLTLCHFFAEKEAHLAVFLEHIIFDICRYFQDKQCLGSLYEFALLYHFGEENGDK